MLLKDFDLWDILDVEDDALEEVAFEYSKLWAGLFHIHEGLEGADVELLDIHKYAVGVILDVKKGETEGSTLTDFGKKRKALGVLAKNRCSLQRSKGRKTRMNRSLIIAGMTLSRTVGIFVM